MKTMLKIKRTTLDDGCQFTGSYFNGQRHGIGLKRYANGARFIGIYKNDARHGYGIKQHANGKMIIVKYKEGEKIK